MVLERLQRLLANLLERSTALAQAPLIELSEQARRG
jgi:hypothetical protein